MKTICILTLLLISFKLYAGNVKIDFGNGKDKTNDWVMISDNIMGGVSSSKLEFNEDALKLSGDISLDNFGGFSSVKTKFKKVDLSAYKGIRIRHKSNNQKFAFTLEVTQNWTLPNYKGAFSNNQQLEWEISTIYFKDFKEYQIGEPTGEKLNLGLLQNIVRMGVITTEKKEGPFSLEIDYIELLE